MKSELYVMIACIFLGCKSIGQDTNFNYIQDATGDYVLVRDSFKWCPDSEYFLERSYYNPFYPDIPPDDSRYCRESRTSKRELIKRLEEKVYIPTYADYYYFRSGAIYKNPVMPDQILYEERIELVHAIYSLYFQLTPAEVGELLYHKSLNIRTYAYLFYLSRACDIYYDYLLESFNQEEVIIAEIPVYYLGDGEYNLSTMLLSFVFNAIEFPKILPLDKKCCYDITDQQRNSLFTLFYECLDNPDDPDYFENIVKLGITNKLNPNIFPCEGMPEDAPVLKHEDPADFRRKNK